MSNLLPSRYPLDLTGSSTDNLVSGESHVLATRKYRSVVTKYGPYYAGSLIVVDTIGNKRLMRGADYRCVDLVSLPSAQSGKEVFTTILIINPAISNNIQVSYQAVGGGYEKAYDGIRLLLDNLMKDDRPIEWPNIVNRPEVFDPVLHLEPLGDGIGFEYLVEAIERVRSTLLLGDQIGHDQLLKYIDSHIQALTQLLDDRQLNTTSGALAQAKTAATSAALAMNFIIKLNDEVAKIESEVGRVSRLAEELTQGAKTAEATARALLISSPSQFLAAGNTSFISPIPFNAEVPLFFPVAEAVGVVDSDTYAIGAQGNIIQGLTIAQLDAAPAGNICLSAKLILSKQVTTGLACLDLIFKAHDYRDAALSGIYVDQMQIDLYPLKLFSAAGELSSVFCHTLNKQQSGVAADNVARTITYQIQGVDSTYGSLTDLATRRIADHLADFRSDFNARGYGTAQRKLVSFKIPPGTEMKLSFYFSGTEIAMLRRNLNVMFEHLVLIKNNTSTLFANPHAGKIKALTGRFN
jgi:hypothetical protein